MDLFEFEAAVLRLKEAAGVRTDREVAALLGMEPSAFNKRKRRGSFPARELEALAAAQPGLQIDVRYVLKGGTQLERAQASAAGTSSMRHARERAVAWPDSGPPRSSAEATLLADWRACSKRDRETISELAARLAKP